MKKTIVVAVGILYQDKQTILLNKRPKNSFMSGFWELAGGKVEAGESTAGALARELQEELAITVFDSRLRLTMTYEYPDRIVHLSVLDVLSYQGTPIGCEGQKIAWVKLQDMTKYPLLPTMARIVNNLLLPDMYWITPEQVKLSQIQAKLTQGIRQIQFRIKQKLDANLQDLIEKTQILCENYQAKLLLNSPNNLDFSNHNLHLNSTQLMQSKNRPIADNLLLGVSVHNPVELNKAVEIGADFAVLSPVLATKSHPNATLLGWEKTAKLINNNPLPIYCLGGMGRQQLIQAKNIGAIGIAGISQI